MLIQKLFYILVFIIGPISPLIYASSDKASPVVIESGKDFYEIGLHLDILEDKESKLKIEDIVSGKYESQFKKSSQKVPNYGLTKSTFWGRVTVINKTSLKRDWFLSFNYVTQDLVAYYKKVCLKKNIDPCPKEEWVFEEMGDRKKFSDKKYKIRPFVFEMGQKEKETYYVKVSGSPTQINLTLLQKKKMLMIEGDDNTKLSLFFGIVASMVLYNLFIFLSSLD